MAGFYVMSGTGEPARSVADADISRWRDLKQRTISDQLTSDAIHVAIIGTTQTPERKIARTPVGDWLSSAGAWIHTPGKIAQGESQTLLERYLSIGAKALAQELDGTFALAIGDNRSGKIYIISDPRGSLHVYLRSTPTGVAICTSSMALSETGQLDPVGCYEFITTGIIYEDRSLWVGVHKISQATLIELDHGRIHNTTTYWNFADAFTRTLTLDEAGEVLKSAMRDTLKTIGASSNSPLLADLTGGYDSRLLLLGMLESGVQFDNTVVGAESSADVVVARRIAERLGLNLHAMPEIDHFDHDEFLDAIRLGDGEINAFEYANIKRNQAPFVTGHAASLNGSFGEVARGYWWELIWPKLNACKPLDGAMLSKKRFAALPFTEVFNNRPVESLVHHLAGVVTRAVAPAQGLPLTAQMDCAYLGIRMQRWQGRIASNTNQIWPAMAPLGMTAILTPMLAAKPEARIRSLLPRHIFRKYHPALADMPLEHGFPPTEATLANLHRFTPLLGYYGHKVVSKLAGKFKHSQPTIPPPSIVQRYSTLPLDVLPAPKLLASGLFSESALRSLLDPDQPIGGNRLTQWQRLLTVEFALQTLSAAFGRSQNHCNIRTDVTNVAEEFNTAAP